MVIKANQITYSFIKCSKIEYVWFKDLVRKYSTVPHFHDSEKKESGGQDVGSVTFEEL
jgi:hypothetical protein